MSDDEAELTPQQLIANAAKATADAISNSLTSRSASIALPTYDWDSKDAFRTFSLFRQTLDNWLFLNRVKTDSEDHLRYAFAALGTKALELHAQWTPTGTEEERKVTKAKASAFLQRIQDGMTHEVNTHVRLAELEDVIAKPNEDPQELVARIKTLMDRCEMINDAHREHELCRRIVRAYRNEARLLDKLMAKSFKTPSNELTDIAVNHFAIQRAREQVSNNTKPIDAIRQERHRPGRGRGRPSGHGHTQPSYPDCANCTKRHQPGRAHCPAKDSKCDKCQKIGHWRPKCRGGRPPPRTQGPPRGQQGTNRGTYKRHTGQKRTDAIDIADGDSPPDEVSLYGIKFVNDHTTDVNPTEITVGDITTSHSEAFTNVTLPAPAGVKRHEADIRVKVDTGAGGNILPLRVFRQMYPDRIDQQGLPLGLTQTQTRLFAYNGTRIPQHGALDTWTRWKPPDHRPRCLRTRWYIADTDGPAILGLPASQKLGVVIMNCAVHSGAPFPQHQHVNEKPATTAQELPIIKDLEGLRQEYPDRFEGIGCFSGKYHITLKPDAKPVIHAPRKCPIAMRPHVKAELDRLEGLKVIRKVDEPTDWVSSLVYAWKPNGKVRACLNAKELNSSIKRDHHRTPTVEEITHNFAGSTIFTKVDGTASYYCVELDEESQLLTTFTSPFGRYCFQRLPPGLVCSQDIFQKKIDQILEQCTGVIGIADDFCIHGKDVKEHNDRLHHFMKIARKCGLVLNIDKCSVAQQRITFFGNVYDEHGCHPDPAKVEAIHAMPRPTSRTKLQEFLGMVTWLAPFIPNMSENTATLRELLRQDTEFTMG